jgi:hemerythrin-like metal-binding protein
MPLIQWNDKYNVGVRTLDGQHRQLIDIINDLHEAMFKGQAKEVQAGLLQRLGQYAAEHLNTEERMLSSNGYPDFVQHKAQHDNYIAKVRELEKQVGTGKLSLGVTLLPFLKDWWTGHIMKTDQQYAPFFKQKGVL